MSRTALVSSRVPGFTRAAFVLGTVMPRRTALALALAVLAPTALAETPLVPIDQVAREYTRPHQLVDIGGGRKLNLHCMGPGEPTVVMD